MENRGSINSAKPEVESLLAVLNVAEEILFSFPLPTELVNKYEYIREQSFEKACLLHSASKIWALQAEAHSRNKNKPKIDNEAQTNLSELYRFDEDSESVTVRGIIGKFTNVLDSSTKFINEVKKRVYQLLDKDQRASFQSSSWYESDSPLKIDDLADKSDGKSLKMIEEEINSKIEAFSIWLDKSEIEVFSKMDKAIENTLILNANIQNLENELGKIVDRYENEKEQIENDLNKEIYRLQEEIKENEVKIKDLKENLSKNKARSFDESRRIFSGEVEKLINEKEVFEEENEKLKIELEETAKSLEEKTKELELSYDHIKRSSDAEVSDARESEQKLRQQIEVLKSKWNSRESELTKIMQLSSEKDQETINDLKSSIEKSNKKIKDLETVLEIVKETSFNIYQCFNIAVGEEFYTKRQEITKNYSFLHGDNLQLVIEVEFMGHLIYQLNIGNGELIEKIKSLETENQQLKEIKSKKEEMIHGILHNYENSNKALQDFNESRKRLTEQFQDKSQEPFKSPKGGQTFMKLYQKYLGEESS